LGGRPATAFAATSAATSAATITDAASQPKPAATSQSQPTEPAVTACLHFHKRFFV
jgi:hypothetical protein